MKKSIIFSLIVSCVWTQAVNADDKKLQATANLINATANFLNALNGNGGQQIQPGLMQALCVGNNARSYDNCIGTALYVNGNIYAGEFVKGRRQGMGAIRILTQGVPSDHYIGSNVPSTYVGQFNDDRINGFGN